MLTKLWEMGLKFQHTPYNDQYMYIVPVCWTVHLWSVQIYYKGTYIIYTTPWTVLPLNATCTEYHLPSIGGKLRHQKVPWPKPRQVPTLLPATPRLHSNWNIDVNGKSGFEIMTLFNYCSQEASPWCRAPAKEWYIK